MSYPIWPPSAQAANNPISTPAPRYRSLIRQHPDRARMSGMGEQVSRRMLDPPLILQLDILPSPTLYNPEQLASLGNIVMCSVVLYHATESQIQAVADIPPMPQRTELSRYVPILLGERVKNARYLDTSENTKKHFFVFNDLSVRIQGKFRLHCTVFNLFSGQMETLYTNVFEVFSPQYYPGILEPTPLSKWLYIQGIQVRAGFHSHKEAGTKVSKKQSTVSSISSRSTSTPPYSTGEAARKKDSNEETDDAFGSRLRRPTEGNPNQP